ncbi:hypothetical protein [Sedimenticola hydrogenitrophicus]|uniref:hypothetical protein n=1 Tax=Sedimenticola hydrogenitrophicus TaxID=2967975 RepID=UPI002FFBED83
MLEMLLPVAEALGQELLAHVAFVGGSTTAFLITDPITRQAVRFTEDVDLIVHVGGRPSGKHGRGSCMLVDSGRACRTM